MNKKIKISTEEYLSKLWANFNESTMISPNNAGKKEKGKMNKSTIEIKKDLLSEFTISYSIPTKELLLAALTLTLNKFNFSNETLIFNENNVPFATKFEKRQIPIKEFLQKVHENFNKRECPLINFYI